MKYLRILMSLFIALALIYFTIKWTNADIRDSIKNANRIPLLAGLLLYGVNVGLGSHRFRLLLSVQQIGISFIQSVRLTLIGSFFSLVIPGAVSGDIIKISLITQHTDKKKAEAAFIVFIDRMLGLFGLQTLTLLVLLFSGPFIAELGRENQPIQLAVYAIGIGCSLSIVLIMLVEIREKLLRLGPVQRIVAKISDRLPVFILSILRRLDDVLEMYRKNKKVVLSGLLISVLVHVFAALILLCIGVGIGDENPSIPGYLITTSVANAVAAIPVTPAGLGTRDGTIAIFLNAMNVPAGKSGTIPVMMTLVIVFWSLIGGILLLFYKKPINTDTSLHVPH